MPNDQRLFVFGIRIHLEELANRMTEQVTKTSPPRRLFTMPVIIVPNGNIATASTVHE